MDNFLFFLEVLIGGLLAGVMYSLVALGFVLIYKASWFSISLRARWCSSPCCPLSGSWNWA
jgi:hypothetical protein